MAARAVWRGFLKVGSVTCAVKLINAASEAGKIHFRILNRKGRLPVKSAYVDEGTGAVVEAADQVKGYELDNGAFALVEPDEIKALRLESEHTLDVEEFVRQAEIDQRYRDKPYYVVPADAGAAEPFAVIRESLKRQQAAARSCVMLYQRGREVLIEPKGDIMLMTTMRNHNELVDAGSVFDDLRKVKVDPEMSEIAELIIDKKTGSFDPSTFEDTYENALLEMIKAKRAGKAPVRPVAAPKASVVNLADLLRKSLAKEGLKAPARRDRAAPAKNASSAA
jgi:DNA end-binding protein Ku